MQAAGSDDLLASHATAVRVYARWLRPALATAGVVARVNAVALAGVLARSAAFERVALPSAELVLEFALVSLLPWALAALLRGGARGEAVVSADALTLTTRHRRVEVRIASIAGASAWRCPLPAPGVALRMRSGQPFPWAVEAGDPGAVVRPLASASAHALDAAGDDAAAEWAAARQRLRPGALELVVRWIVLPAGIAAVLFRADQMITYGDPLGALHLRGGMAAARAFGAYLVASLAALVLIAAAARVVGETASAAWTAVSPRRARAARSAAEWLCRAAVYGVPPALLAFRFFG